MKIPCSAADNQQPLISVIVPVYRNADTLRELHRRLSETLDRESLSHEIIFVDDACPAGSLAVLEDLARRDRRVAALALARNVGQHRAVLIGLAHARGDWLVTMDADLQDPPEAIPDLLRKIREGYAAVFAGRRGKYESATRLITSRLFKRLLHVLGGVPIDAGLFVMMSRQMAQRVLSLRAPRPFVVAMIGSTGLPLASIPVERSTRPGGRSAYTAWDRLKAGSLAIAWTLVWRLRRGQTMARPAWGEAPIRAHVGVRFTSVEPASVSADSPSTL